MVIQIGSGAVQFIDFVLLTAALSQTFNLDIPNFHGFERCQSCRLWHLIPLDLVKERIPATLICLQSHCFRFATSLENPLSNESCPNSPSYSAFPAAVVMLTEMQRHGRVKSSALTSLGVHMCHYALQFTQPPLLSFRYYLEKNPRCGVSQSSQILS